MGIISYLGPKPYDLLHYACVAKNYEFVEYAEVVDILLELLNIPSTHFLGILI